MPSYDYLCRNCGHRFEAFQKISDKPLTKCPKCSAHVERLITGGSGFIFKGSGFYITDYKRSHTSASKPEAHSSPKSAEKTGTESKTHTGPTKVTEKTAA